MKRADEKTKEELLIHERSKGKSLRQLGRMFGMSHETARQRLSKYHRAQGRLLPEQRVATDLGYSVEWLRKLRREGIIKPIKQGFWLYSEEQVRQIPSIIAETRKCEHCGEPRPRHSKKWCSECLQYRRKYGNLARHKNKDDKGLSDH